VTTVYPFADGHPFSRSVSWRLNSSNGLSRWYECNRQTTDGQIALRKNVQASADSLALQEVMPPSNILAVYTGKCRQSVVRRRFRAVRRLVRRW